MDLPILDISFKWTFLVSCPASFIYHNIFHIHLQCSTYQYFLPFYCQIRFHCMDTPRFVHPFISWVVSTLGLFLLVLWAPVYKHPLKFCVWGERLIPLTLVPALLLHMKSFVLWLKRKPREQPDSPSRVWTLASRAVQVKAGNGELPRGSSRVIFDTPPRLPTAVFPVLPVTSAATAATSGSPLCLPPSHPATCIFSAEGRLHTASLVLASKHPPPFGKPAAEQGMRMRASRRTKDVSGGGDAHAQWERDSGSFGAGPIGKRSPAGQGGAHLIGQSQAWVKVAALKKHDIKKDTSPTSGRKPVPQQGSVASGHPTRTPTFFSALQIQSWIACTFLGPCPSSASDLLRRDLNFSAVVNGESVWGFFLEWWNVLEISCSGGCPTLWIY